MAREQIGLHLAGLPEVRAMLGAYSGRALEARMKRGLRAGAAAFRIPLRDQLSRQLKRRGTRTRAHRTPLGVSITPSTPLWTIFERGAGEHDIGSSGQLLANKKAGFVARAPVAHPGVAARPIVGPVFAAQEHAAGEAIRRELFS